MTSRLPKPTLPAVPTGFVRARDVVRSRAQVVRPWLQRLAPARAVLSCVSGLGWVVLGSAVVSWLAARQLHWVELSCAAIFAMVIFAAACALTIGRTKLQVVLQVKPSRVQVGAAAAVEVSVTNIGRSPMLSAPLDLFTANRMTRFVLPALAAGANFSDIVVLPTGQRGVYRIGPANTVKGDPFGLVRRELTWTSPEQLFVHPLTVHLATFSSGLLRDLEGRTTNAVSSSDLAFHALREYAPDDDRRHIHWKSTAKRAGLSSDANSFMVKQFLDTRRSHVGVVVDCDRAAYVETDDFECALSVGASIVVRALVDEMESSQVCGDLVVTNPAKHVALDTFSRADLGPHNLTSQAALLRRSAPSLSTAVLVTGPLTEFAAMRRATAHFGPDVNTVVLRVEGGATTALRRTGGVTMLTIGELGALPRALAGRVSG